MKLTHKIAAGIAASVSLGLAAAVFAHPGQMGSGAGPQAQGGMQHGAQRGMQGGAQHGMQGSRGPGAMGHGAAGHGAGAQLMTPEERTALQEKMRNATPEERQKLAEATRTEMQKRATEKGITLPEHRGPHFGATPQAPATK